MLFKSKKVMKVPAENQKETDGRSSAMLLSAGDTIEFLAGEETHVPLIIHSVSKDDTGIPRISLQRTPGMFTLPEMTAGDKAFFYAIHGGSRPIACTGTILSASRIKAEIGDISVESLDERRSGFRLPLNGTVVLSGQDDLAKRNKIEATLINVSSDGISFCTKKDFEEGAIFNATFRLHSGGAWITHPGQIIWVKELPSGAKKYGMIFSLLEEQQREDLMSEIFKAQKSRRIR